jgi:hypothetical protein
MKLRAARAVFTRAIAISGLILVTGCANVSTGVGVSFPIGPFGSIGVGVGSGGRVGASVGVGVGPATVGVGASGQLPESQKAEQNAEQKPPEPAKPESGRR